MYKLMFVELKLCGGFLYRYPPLFSEGVVIRRMVTVVAVISEFSEDLSKTLKSIYSHPGRVKTIVVNALPKDAQKESGGYSVVIEKYKADNPGMVREIKACGEPVFSALRQALAHVDTPYVQFVRAGDRFIAYALKRTVKFLDAHKFETDVAYMTRLRERKKKLDRGSFVIDLTQNDSFVPYEFFSAVMKTKAVKNFGFRDDIPFDAGFDTLIKIIMKKLKVCWVKDAFIFTDEPIPSQLGTFRDCLKEEWYLDAVLNYELPLIAYAKQELTYVPVYVQQLLYYSLKLKFYHNENNNNHHIIDDCTDEFFDLCHKVLLNIEDNVILNRYTAPYNKTSQTLVSVFLRLKYSRQFQEYYVSHGRNFFLCFQHYALFNSLAQPARIDIMDYDGENLTVDASIVGVFDFKICRLHICFDGRDVPYEEVYRFAHTKYFGLSASKRYTFRFVLTAEMLENISAGGELTFFLTFNGIDSQCRISTSRYTSKITSMTTFSYWNFGDYTMTWHTDNALCISKRRLPKSMWCEAKFLARTALQPGYGWKMTIVRMAYWLSYPFLHNRNIWITYDKLYKGGDCGEYFYKYASAQDGNVTACYVVNRDCPDRERLENEGFKPLVFGTLKQKLYYLFASVVLNTHAGTHSFCSFSNEPVNFVQNLIKSDCMCIQHGLTVQQLAFEENQAFNNTKRYYCASKYEIKNLSHPIYGYFDKSALKLTGIPRYDGLVNDDKKQILITPTWRNYISMPSVMGKSRPYNPYFKETDYFKIYNGLIADEKLLETAKRTGYQLIYLLHPVISSQIKDYTVKKGVKIIPATEVNYERILTQSSLMVTDYSGVQFDFAYMKKPVVYFHPPELPPHYKEGGFFYETMGFGEICTAKDELVDVLCGYMENGCEMSGEYLERQKDFYAFDDLNSCKRIYDDVISYQKKHMPWFFKKG